MTVTIKHRGWPGHLAIADQCRYRRNTLVSDGDRHIVISTIGAVFPTPLCPKGNRFYAIGIGGRVIETKVFVGVKEGEYIDADVMQQVSGGDARWSICLDDLTVVPPSIDNEADDMHDANVADVVANFDARYASGAYREAP